MIVLTILVHTDHDNVITTILRSIMFQLPMAIEAVEWDGVQLGLGGPEWSLGVLSAWRITRGGLLVIGPDDAVDCSPIMLDLQGRHIVGTGIREGALDPYFELDDGRVLELFSTSTVEPWIITIGVAQEMKVFVADPSAPIWRSNL